MRTFYSIFEDQKHVLYAWCNPSASSRLTAVFLRGFLCTADFNHYAYFKIDDEILLTKPLYNAYLIDAKSIRSIDVCGKQN